MYKAKNLALYIIRERIRAGKPISNYRLQQILLLCQIRHLKTTNAPLFEDSFTKTSSDFRITDVYHDFAIWGGSRITRMDEKPNEFIDFPDLVFINEVVNSLNGLEVWEVSALRELAEMRTLTVNLEENSTIDIRSIVKQMSEIQLPRPKIDYPAFGVNIPCFITTNYYAVGGGFALEAIVAKDTATLDGQKFMSGEPFATITINVPTFKLGHNCVLLDTNDCPNITDILEGVHLGHATDRYATSGFCEYPEWEFTTEELLRMS